MRERERKKRGGGGGRGELKERASISSHKHKSESKAGMIKRGKQSTAPDVMLCRASVPFQSLISIHITVSFPSGLELLPRLPFRDTSVIPNENAGIYNKHRLLSKCLHSDHGPPTLDSLTHTQKA